jgi:hypothetical protein
MSEGTRIPLADADKAAAFLFERWGLDPATCMVVGSVRRRRESVGDLELVAPAWDRRGSDTLFEQINQSMEVQVTVERQQWDLFSTGDTTEMIVRTSHPPIGHVIQGLKPGFLHARVALKRRSSGLFIPCEVYRYTPENRGWSILMRTGPVDFGRAFLTYWKTRFGIPMGEDGKASIDGHLVDASGAVVPVPTEEIAFQKCGLTWKPPAERDEFAAAWVNQNRRGR